nr:MAG TPA: hypothetical protein [Caudoviricetes sp.]
MFGGKAACSGGTAPRDGSSVDGGQAALPAGGEMNRRLVRARARPMLFYRGRGRSKP